MDAFKRLNSTFQKYTNSGSSSAAANSNQQRNPAKVPAPFSVDFADSAPSIEPGHHNPLKGMKRRTREPGDRHDESALKQPPGAEDDVIVVGMRTPAERNAAGCKRAISLESPLESIKRSKTASLALQTDVVTARSINTADHEKRFKELFQPAFDAYCKDEIDVVELDRRKKAAQETAGTDYPPLTALDAAFSAYEAAVKAREDAEEAAEKMLANAHAAEDAAEAQVRSLLAQSAAFPSAGGAGPSGVVKSE